MEGEATITMTAWKHEDGQPPPGETIETKTYVWHEKAVDGTEQPVDAPKKMKTKAQRRAERDAQLAAMKANRQMVNHPPSGFAFGQALEEIRRLPPEQLASMLVGAQTELALAVNAHTYLSERLRTQAAERDALEAALAEERKDRETAEVLAVRLDDVLRSVERERQAERERASQMLAAAHRENDELRKQCGQPVATKTRPRAARKVGKKR